MTKLVFFLILLYSPPLHAQFEVDFPVTPKPSPQRATAIPTFQSAQSEKPTPIFRDQVLVYYSAPHYYGGTIRKPEDFDTLKPGMSLRKIVSLLGPGSQNSMEGIGFIGWRCSDGRRLNVWPSASGNINKKASFHIDLKRTNHRHKEVAKMTKGLISKIEVNSQDVIVSLHVDTHQAKANVEKTYKVGETFQKVEPLPRIDFTITKIEGNSVHCYYFYQARPAGLLRYTETGSLILKQINKSNAIDQ